MAEAAPGEKVLAFYCKIADPSPWYNNQTYLDTLSAEAVRRFIEVTYAAYTKNIGKKIRFHFARDFLPSGRKVINNNYKGLNGQVG